LAPFCVLRETLVRPFVGKADVLTLSVHREKIKRELGQL
jgi:hypothetical protein